MALSIFVTLNGTIMSGARIPFAAARDRLFFRSFAHIHPRWQSPSTSLIVQGALSTVLLLFLSSSSSSLSWPSSPSGSSTCSPQPPSSSIAAAQPDRTRPYRVWGYPVLPAIFVVCAGGGAGLELMPATCKARCSAPASSCSDCRSCGLYGGSRDCVRIARDF